MNELGKAVVTSIQLDAETVSNLVSLRIVNDGQQLRNASGSSKSESERVLDYLCPAVKRGGNRALERLYQVLMYTRVGRMGHEELAKSIKRKGVYVCAFLLAMSTQRHNGICNYMWGINILEASQGAWLVYESQFKPRVMIDLHSFHVSTGAVSQQNNNIFVVL